MKPNIMQFVLFLVMLLYLMFSKAIFDKVYKTSQIVIDELFHVPQGSRYCMFEFLYWDPKITTFPGLYLLSTLHTNAFWSDCTTYRLRVTSLLASVVNLYLFASFFTDHHDFKRGYSMKTIVQSLNLAFLPPLYFYAHVYYTDVVALTFLLIFLKYIMNQTGLNQNFTFIRGFCALLMRQTNVVWFVLPLGKKIIDNFYISSIDYEDGHLRRRNPSINRKNYSLSDVVDALKCHLSTFFKYFFRSFVHADLHVVSTLVMLLVMFAGFVYYNGSVVVGDRLAHKASLHIPQIFYFSLFYGVFAFPLVVKKYKATVNMLRRHRMATLMIMLIFMIIIRFNTLVHPYLLADNRHYTFYIWNRLYGRYPFARYLVAPVYVFLLASMYQNVRHVVSFGFLAPYCACTFVSLALQKMIEVRYFLIPFVILRLKCTQSSWYIILLESLLYLVINIGFYHTFFNKEIIWKNFSDVQRLIW